MTESTLPHDERSTPIGARQTQFLNVISRDEAERRFHEPLSLTPSGTETIPLSAAAGRVLAAGVVAGVDVPSFDRSNVDGFAVIAADIRSATEDAPERLTLNDEVLPPGVRPTTVVTSGTATTIATGGMLPRGADAVLMVEHSDVIGNRDLEVRRAVAAGDNVTFAGTDLSRGETVLQIGQLLTSRELGVVAAVGQETVDVYRRPRVAILSTGDEIIPPGQSLPVGCVYDSNAAILSAAVVECGGEPISLGVIPDDEAQLEAAMKSAMQHDVVLLSGGTSKGAGDLSYRMIERLGKPGIVAHGVALKPGKPICLAVCDGKPVVVLPGFPTSAIFTFQEFVAPVIRRLSGQPHDQRRTVTATLPMRINSQRGRTEYMLVSLFERIEQSRQGAERDTDHAPRALPKSPLLAAYPMGKGSGSVTTFSRADGFITIDAQAEIVEEGTTVDVTLLDERLRPADLTVITSHCIGLDRLLSHVQQRGFTIKVMSIGSTGALAAAQRGECDIAGIHLLDAESGEYNRPFLTDDVEWVRGYGRMQCLVFRPDDERWTRFASGNARTDRAKGKAVSGRSTDLQSSTHDLVSSMIDTADARMVNRNAGSGTRILIDRLLSEIGEGVDKPAGYGVQVRSHNAVCSAVQQGRADWGVAIDTVGAMYDLVALPIAEEQFDFVIPRSRRDRPAVQAFVEILGETEVRDELREAGFRL